MYSPFINLRPFLYTLYRIWTGFARSLGKVSIRKGCSRNYALPRIFADLLGSGLINFINILGDNGFANTAIQSVAGHTELSTAQAHCFIATKKQREDLQRIVDRKVLTFRLQFDTQINILAYLKSKNKKVVTLTKIDRMSNHDD